MTKLIPFEFDRQQVRVIEGDDGDSLFVARDIAAALGYARPTKAIQDHCRGVLKRDIPTVSGVQAFSVIREPDVYRLIVRSKLPAAERFESWVFDEVLPQIRQHGRYEVSPTQPETNVAATMALVECAASLLRASDSGKVIMLRKAGMAVGADTSFLPVYTEDSAPGHVGAMDTSSLSQLLSERGCSLSAATANQILIRLGLLESRKRKGSNGQSKEFKCITQAGQEYGKNIVSPQSPRETQPHWYRERFDALLLLMAQEGAA